MTKFPQSLTSTGPCTGCQTGQDLDFDFAFAFQPIVDLRDQSIFANEALVRGSNGEGALSVLNRVNDDNRYRFDQACRVKAIELASRLGLASLPDCRSASIFCPMRCTDPRPASAPPWKRLRSLTFRTAASCLK